eukprot:1288362-Pyramimonas_sp.AAC.1
MSRRDTLFRWMIDVHTHLSVVDCVCDLPIITDGAAWTAIFHSDLGVHRHLLNDGLLVRHVRQGRAPRGH